MNKDFRPRTKFFTNGWYNYDELGGTMDTTSDTQTEETKVEYYYYYVCPETKDEKSGGATYGEGKKSKSEKSSSKKGKKKSKKSGMKESKKGKSGKGKQSKSKSRRRLSESTNQEERPRRLRS